MVSDKKMYLGLNRETIYNMFFELTVFLSFVLVFSFVVVFVGVVFIVIVKKQLGRLIRKCVEV